MERAPVAPTVFTPGIREHVVKLKYRFAEIQVATTAIRDWLRHEFGVERSGRPLTEPHKLDVDSFVTAVRAGVTKEP
jgi:hypothetical protein